MICIRSLKIHYRQLFVSTHNFGFFTLLKELPTDKYNKESKYFISRNLNEFIVENLPSIYGAFAAEYHYLFAEILKFTNEQNKSTSTKLLLMPEMFC
jgi:AAA domain